MNTLLAETTRIARLLAGEPSSSVEVSTIWTAIFLVSTISIIIVGRTVRSTFGYSIPRAVILTTVNISVLLLSIAVANLHLIPAVNASSIRGIVPGGLVVVAVTGISAPMCRWLHKTKYSKALFTILLSIVFSAGVMFIIRSGFTGARNSKASADKIRSNTEKAKKVLE